MRAHLTRRHVLWLLAAGWSVACGGRSGQGGPGQTMGFALQQYKTAEEAEKALLQELPLGTPRWKVEEFAGGLGPGATVSMGSDHVAVRYVEPSKTMVHAVWALGFFFDERRQLARVKVSRGLTGP